MDKIINVVRGIIKLSIFTFIIIVFLIWSFICHYSIRNPNKRLKRFSQNTQFFSNLLLKVFNVDIDVINKPSFDQKFLLVSNHMGFVDILMLASCYPMLFVTSFEMKETPFLGLLTELGGCIYVERRNRNNILNEMGSIIESLQNGFKVTLYPEATSTNGEQVLPFKRTLMMAAGHAGVPIQPVVVNFHQVNGEPFTIKWRDHVCWYGDIPFIISMWKSATLKSVKAEVEFLDQVFPNPDDDRSHIANKVHALVSTKFRPVRSNHTEEA